MRRRYSLLGLICALMLAAVGAGTAMAASLPSTIKDANGGLGTRPKVIVLSEDGSAYIGGANLKTGSISWRSYTSSTAVGTGYFQENNCEPNCASGHYVAYPVTIKLTQPHHSHGKFLFTRMALSFSHGEPSYLKKSPHPFAAKYASGQFFWNY